jgi:hypothetical protein
MAATAKTTPASAPFVLFLSGAVEQPDAGAGVSNELLAPASAAPVPPPVPVPLPLPPVPVPVPPPVPVPVPPVPVPVPPPVPVPVPPVPDPPVLPATHVRVPVSQTGAPALLQSAFVSQPTHAPVPGSQTWGAAQSLLALQPLHVLVAVLHTGLVPLQSALARQATHVVVETSHFGVAPEHSASFAQPRHEPVVVSQTFFPSVVQSAFVVHFGAMH